MKSVLFKLFFFLVIGSFNTHSQTVVYNGLYGVEALLHVEDHVIYKGLYGYDALVHVEDDVIYKGMYGYDALAHIEDGVIYKGMYGYDAIAHLEGYMSDIELYAVLLLILEF